MIKAIRVVLFGGLGLVLGGLVGIAVPIVLAFAYVSLSDYDGPDKMSPTIVFALLIPFTAAAGALWGASFGVGFAVTDRDRRLETPLLDEYERGLRGGGEGADVQTGFPDEQTRAHDVSRGS